MAKSKRGKVRYQKAIKGERREPASASLKRAIKRAVRDEARRYGVSQSFVVAVALQWALNADVEQDQYTTRNRPMLRVYAGGRR